MDELLQILLPWGLPGLAVASFLAATLLPFSSEVALTAAIVGGIPPAEAVVAASLGNCLATAFNYGLGYFARERAQQRLERSRVGRVAMGWMDRLGPWSLLLSWLPLVGDPLTVLGGVARVPFPLFAALVFSTRIARYILLALAAAP